LTPDKQAAAKEQLAAVQSAIATLPHDLREVLVLSTWHDMSQAEIASVLHTSTKAVETRLYRARKILRDMLADKLGDL
jgi:RNA polymerase sigma factor (sigma-70 family)